MRERGFTLLEMLVSLGLMGLIFAGVLSFFMDTTRRARDAAIVAETQDQARSLGDLMSFELRMAGAGMPPGWRIGEKTGTGPRGTSNDIGVLWPPGRAPVVLACYLTGSTADGARRDAALAAVGRSVAQWVAA